jgi:hypothetical protein
MWSKKKMGVRRCTNVVRIAMLGVLVLMMATTMLKETNMV